jgi:predicted outer membrane protein
MKKSIALSAAVLAATFTFCPISRAADDAAADQARQSAQQAGRDARDAAQGAQQRAQQGAAGIRGEDAEQRNPDQRFIREASADNQFEIQQGQAIGEQAQNPQVKQLAQMIVQDHQQAQQQLQQVAQQMNMEVPTQLEQWQQDKLQAMQQKHGEHVERAFTFGQVGAHHIDILKYRYAAEHAQNPQLKQYAQQTVSTLEKHLRMAEEAAEQWVPEARTAGERMRGEPRANPGAAKSSLEGTNATPGAGVTGNGNNPGTGGNK